MESLDKQLRDTVLQAMARAYPDPVDLVLLSMVTGCEVAALEAETGELISAGLAQGPHAGIPAWPRLQSAYITDRGMTVACSQATNESEASALVYKLEARTLRALLCARAYASRLPAAQINELCEAISNVPDGALIDAARVCAHQPVSDWRPLVQALVPQQSETTSPVDVG